MGNCYSKIISVRATVGVISITVALAVWLALILSLQSYVHTPPDLPMAIGSLVMKLPGTERKSGQLGQRNLKEE